MKYTENLERLIRSFCAVKKSAVKTTTELDEKVIDDALLAQKQSTTAQSAAVQPNMWRIMMRSKTAGYAAAAVIILVIIIGIVHLGKPIGASVAFAAAMDRVRQARTFKCTEITERPLRGGKEGEKFLFKNTWMFKEPDWERHEMPKSPSGKVINEVTITHYGKRQRLRLRPVEMRATLHDMSSDYTIDDRTGKLKLTQLRTDLRDRLRKTSAGAVDDLGEAVLEGKSVRVLRSRKDKRVTTVWIDPQTNHPVQIEHKWPEQDRSPLLYTSVQIDVELDNDLFSLEPPEGYTVNVTKALYPDERMKMVAKIMHMGKCCLIYRSNHNNEFPNELADIVAVGIMSQEAFKNVMAAPDDPNGGPVIRYRQPDANAHDRDIEVMLYEVREEGSGDGRVMVVMLDSHAELMPVQTLAQLLKPWPEHKKKLAANMTRLHWFCDRYAEEHGGKYPSKLDDLVGTEVWEEVVGTEFSEDIIQRLQAPWGQLDAPVVIQYRSPRDDADLASALIMYEICDQWPEDGVVACFGDGHCELIVDQNRFEESIR